jgi:hypothetical protein
LGPEEVDRLCRFASRHGDQWGTEICAYLGLSPARAVDVVLLPGLAVPMTKGEVVVVGVAAGAVSGALAHELVHAIAGPSPSQLHREGLAVHVDSQLHPAGPVWPFFELAPHRWVQTFVEDGTLLPLAQLIDGPRVVPSGDGGITDAARWYLEAASVVGFLVERIGINAYWPIYRSGFHASDDLASLQAAWLAGLGGPTTDREWRNRHRSLVRFEIYGRLEGLPTLPVGAVASP